MTQSSLESGLEAKIQFDKRGGLVPVVVQDAATKDVLMLAYANREALDTTLRTGYATFWSTSRDELWTKGATSGDRILVDQVLVDCDQDALVYQGTLEGKGVCHTKDEQGETRYSCFYRSLNPDGSLFWR